MSAPTTDRPATDHGAEHHRPESVVRKAIVRFTAGSLVALLVLGVGITVISQRIARTKALEDARASAAFLANTLAARNVDADLRAHRPGADAALVRVMKTRIENGTLRHIKLWSTDGSIIWSDERALINKRFPMDEDVTDLFGTRKVTAELSQLDKKENAHERDEGELLEVYAGTYDRDGQPMVFEAYLSTADMREDEKAIILGIMPLSIGALLLFLATVLPMAVSLARRVDHGHAERSKMMRHALLASDLERRRIAQDLHDGVIQDLAGLSYVMPSIERHIPAEDSTREAKASLARAAQILQRDVLALRSLITDIYPPDLHGQGLASAVQDLAHNTAERGIAVEADLPAELDVPVDAARLAYRVIREGLRNVVKHAGARSAVVQLQRQDDRLVVRVADDGRGVAAGEKAERGHVGLSLLGDTVRDFGGELFLRPRPEGGTALEAVFPVALVSS